MNDFNRLLVQVKEQALNVGIPLPDNIHPGIICNSRAKKRFGCCKKIDGEFYIELSSFMKDAPTDSVRQTIAHELLHTCNGCQNHGRLFKYYAGVMNRAYGYDIKTTSTFEELGIEKNEDAPPSLNYALKCMSCGKIIVRSRMSKIIKHPSQYRCICGGKLKRIK